MRRRPRAHGHAARHGLDGGVASRGELHARPLGKPAQGGYAVGGAQKARLLLEEAASPRAKLRVLTAQVGRVEPADLGPAASGVDREVLEVGVGGSVAHAQVAVGHVELRPRLGFDLSPRGHGLEGEARVVRVEIRGADLPRGAEGGGDGIRHHPPVHHQRLAPPSARLEGGAQAEDSAPTTIRSKLESVMPSPQANFSDCSRR